MRILFIIYLILTSFAIQAQDGVLSWDYPVKPGSEEWRMTSYAEKVEKSQPSKRILNSWNTELLFQYCIDYPFNKVIGMFNNPNDGFTRVFEQSTVWKEFILRKDALNIFVKYFETRPITQLIEIKDS